MSLNFLDTEGGHILVSVLLILFGVFLEMNSVSRGGELIVFALGVLARSMKGANGHNGHSSKSREKSEKPENDKEESK